MKKKLLSILCLVLAVLSLHGIVFAEEVNLFKDKRYVVPISLYLIDTNDGKHLIKSSYGVFVGNEDDGLENLIVNAVDVQASPEELQYMYDSLGIPEEEWDRTNTTVEVTVERDIPIEASIQNISTSLNLAVIKMNEKIFSYNAITFDVDENAVSPTEEVYILDTDSASHSGYVVNESAVNGIKYVQFDSSFDVEQSGNAVFDKDGEFVGLVQNSIDGIHKNALSSKEIVVMLKTLGIYADVADHTIAEIDKSALIAATDVADKLDLTLYTEETAAVMAQRIEEARSIIINSDVTQETVDDAYKQLSLAQDGLVMDKSLAPITIVLIVVVSVLVFGIIVFIIVFNVRKKVLKKKEAKRLEMERKKAPTVNGPFVPSGAKKENKNNSLDNRSGILQINEERAKSTQLARKDNEEKNQKLSRMEGFAPTSTVVNFNEEDTTVLSVMQKPIAPEKKRSYPTLNRNNGGEIIEINRDEFVLGKSVQKADYVIESKSVSREHAKIIFKEGAYYVLDMGSLNGSYLNGNKMEPRQEYKLKAGDVLTFADTEFAFNWDMGV